MAGNRLRLALLCSAQPSGDLALRVCGAAMRAGPPEPDAQLRAWSASNPPDPAPNFAVGSIALEDGVNALEMLQGSLAKVDFPGTRTRRSASTHCRKNLELTQFHAL